MGCTWVLTIFLVSICSFLLSQSKLNPLVWIYNVLVYATTHLNSIKFNKDAPF